MLNHLITLVVLLLFKVELIYHIRLNVSRKIMLLFYSKINKKVQTQKANYPNPGKP